MCPRTRMKLAHLSLTPNTSMKVLISKWCAEHGITVTDPRVQQSSFSSYDFSSSSITSSNFFEPLLGFLKDAAEKCDVEAQKSGVQLLSIYLRTNRRLSLVCTRL